MIKTCPHCKKDLNGLRAKFRYVGLETAKTTDIPKIETECPKCKKTFTEICK